MQETEVQSLGREDPLEKEMATQYSCLENPTDRRASRAIVHRVAKELRHDRATKQQQQTSCHVSKRLSGCSCWHLRFS